MLVVAEFYPSRRDPVLGVWAHRQALAARDAGARCACWSCTAWCRHARRSRPAQAAAASALAGAGARAARAGARRPAGLLRALRLPRSAADVRRSGVPGRRLRWGSRCARVHRSFAFDLVHAHNAVPAGDAVRRVRALHAVRAPLVISVHGGDVLYTAGRVPRRRGRPCTRALAEARAGARQQPGHRRARSRTRRARDARGASRYGHARAGTPATTQRRGADARHGGASGCAQAPRGRAARACGAHAAPPDAALCDRRRRPGASSPAGTG